MMNTIFSPHTGLTSQRKDMCEGGVRGCWWNCSHTPFIVLLHFGTNTSTCLPTCLSISGLLGFDGQLSLVLPGRAAMTFGNEQPLHSLKEKPRPLDYIPYISLILQRLKMKTFSSLLRYTFSSFFTEYLLLSPLH